MLRLGPREQLHEAQRQPLFKRAPESSLPCQRLPCTFCTAPHHLEGTGVEAQSCTGNFRQEFPELVSPSQSSPSFSTPQPLNLKTWAKWSKTEPNWRDFQDQQGLGEGWRRESTGKDNWNWGASLVRADVMGTPRNPHAKTLAKTPSIGRYRARTSHLQ